MISRQEFLQTTRQFSDVEKRGSFYDMALDLIEKGFELEAHFLLLATWNFAYFRYAVNDFHINNYKETLINLKPHFNRFKGLEFRTINFDEYQEDVKKIFSTLSQIKGIGFTGASKIMNLSCPKVFVMWDGYIRGESTQKCYSGLDIVKNSGFKVRKYQKNAEGYIAFLKDMQATFGHIRFRDTKYRTFAKAIDEFNYVNITLPIQKMEKEKKA